MSSFFDSGPLPDWKDIQKWLGKDIPWKLVDNWDQGSDSNWLNHYVKNILEHSKPDARAHTQGIQTETKHDAKFVHVSIKLSPEIEMSKLQLFATSDRLRLLGLPADKKRSVRLPCLVYARTGQAVMKKDRLLVVRFKRRPPEKSEYELFIRS
ncbi:hypothetical protein [Cohnella lupini]|uniref:HSP20 family molecular chaperone IbpA n=1 Tax=Cohnella lupini TaxID=1294267 RepID=A0A3D9IIX7_9BACL|nr:hypothetical protein [Cohnella lupini]RED61688.1 hypothetical protein DFP95_105117 [Cohnella lupini]